MHTLECLHLADRSVGRLPWSSKSLKTLIRIRDLIDYESFLIFFRIRDLIDFESFPTLFIGFFNKESL